jgi:hypothetical protein
VTKLKVQGYSFSLTEPVVLGTPKRIDTCLCPLVTMQARRVVTQTREPGVIFVHGVFCRGKNLLEGVVTDAFYISAKNDEAYAGLDDYPTLLKKSMPLGGPIRLLADYTGAIPEGYKAGFPYLFVLTLQGPAKLVSRSAA